jgi:predicted ribosome quality control (RQC) complex YloA/Tae2 family protein
MLLSQIGRIAPAVLTDWLIVRRLAVELDRELRGARIETAGMTADGAFALALAGRGRQGEVLVMDPFAPTPLAKLAPAQALVPQAGWPRAMADALRGTRIERIASRRGDRLLALDVASQSRFGVASRLRLVAELVPNFGNILLLKGDVVVSAAREFTLAQNARRAIVIGEAYEPPPLPAPQPSSLTLEESLAALGQPGVRPRDQEAAIAALRSIVPLLPLLLARSLVAQAAATPNESAARHAETVTREAERLVEVANEHEALGELFVYREASRVVALHTVALHQYDALSCTREPALLPIVSELAQHALEQRSGAAFTQRVAALQARVAKRRRTLDDERSALERESTDIGGADILRRSGDALYAHLGEVPAGASAFVSPSDPTLLITLDPRLDAKANAALLFKRYRKARAKREHALRRLSELTSEDEFAQELAWELERAEPAALDELTESVERLERRVRKAQGSPRPRRQVALEVRLSNDARVLIGRSPRGNAELTFKTARPDDLWFHARATPGAHVVLRIDSRRAPHDDEVRAAAELAAYHSRARESETVPVDYTQRKYVRRRPNAPPGLVWYTEARSLLVRPRSGT